MGRLAGFSYREIVKRLKQLGFEFHRQAAGSHEIWFTPAICPKAACVPSSGKRTLMHRCFCRSDKYCGQAG